MNREIKFRVWCKKNQKFLKDFEYPNGHSGLFLRVLTGEITDIQPDGEGDISLNFFDEKYYDLTLQQYTGLKDKNGKEIYEGDIITFSTRRYHFGRDKGLQTIKFKSVVIWEDGGFMVSEKQENDTFICAHDKDDAHESLYEIIGNIYEKEKP